MKNLFKFATSFKEFLIKAPNFLNFSYILNRIKAELLQLKLIHLFAREILLIKRLEIGKTKHTFIIHCIKQYYA